LPSAQAKPRYFLTATLVSIDNRAGEQWYVFTGPFGNLTARRKQTRHQPLVSKGEVRIAVEGDATAGDALYFLDWDGKTFKSSRSRKDASASPRRFLKRIFKAHYALFLLRAM